MFDPGGVGDHFIVPRTPFRMARYVIHIRPSSKAGLGPICYGLRFVGKKESEIKIFHPPRIWKICLAKR